MDHTITCHIDPHVLTDEHIDIIRSQRNADSVDIQRSELYDSVEIVTRGPYGPLFCPTTFLLSLPLPDEVIENLVKNRVRGRQPIWPETPEPHISNLQLSIKYTDQKSAMHLASALTALTNKPVMAHPGTYTVGTTLYEPQERWIIVMEEGVIKWEQLTDLLEEHVGSWDYVSVDTVTFDAGGEL